MQAWLSLGSNQQNPLAQLKQALQRLQQAAGIDRLKSSSFYRTPPWGDEQQDDFVNAVVQVETRFEPRPLLALVQRIEADMGRQRTARRWGPRVIDIDILLYGDHMLQSGDLEIPHPRMHERAFVLLPMTELDANLEIPGRGKISGLLAQLDCEGICLLSG